MMSNQRAGIEIAQPTDFMGRRKVAETCQRHLDLIDQQGRIAFKNGRGPFGFHPRQLEQALILLTNQHTH